MKKRINNIGKCFATAILLLVFHVNSFAQESLVSKQWEQRTREILPKLKKEWTEIVNETKTSSTQSQSSTRSTESPQVDVLNAKYIPLPCFVLDYNSYSKLTIESNLEFLMKLDTTRVYYYLLDSKTNNIVSYSGGIVINGQWENNGFGGTVDSNSANNFIRLYAKKIPIYVLRVKYFSNTEWGYHIFIENGQLMCFRPDIPEPQPLLKTLLEFKEGKERQRRAAAAMGYYY